MKLYSFFNSSTSYRVRIALELKGLEYEYVGVNIVKGEHRQSDFEQRNPSRNVPLLVDGDFALGQSLAIIDYLDQRAGDPRLIPLSLPRRARVLEFADLIACDIHPINNLRVLKFLVGPLGQGKDVRDRWYKHWIAEGLAGAEALIQRHGSGPYCFGDAPTLADCCLVPQIYNAVRNECDMAPYPALMRVYEFARQQPAFLRAAPTSQPDAK